MTQQAGASAPEAGKPTLRQFTPYDMMADRLGAMMKTIEELRGFSVRRPYDADLELGITQVTKAVEDMVTLVEVRVEQERESAND